VTAPTLEALLRRCARAAEQMFNDAGEIDPMWLVETAGGEQQLLVTPIEAPEGLAANKYKSELCDRMRKIFSAMEVVRYAVALDCLLSPGLEGLTQEQARQRYAALGYTLANAPDRQEIIVIQAEDEKEFLTAKREIIRPSHGKPYLGKLGAIERPESPVGRFVGLLPSQQHAQALKEVPPGRRRIRSSSELPDDVGKVFVTNVPNAPLQILGRRDPTNGELCVGRVGLHRADVPFPPGIEVVTGPEAKELITAVHQRLTRKASESGLTFEAYMEQEGAAQRAGVPPKTEREVERYARIERAYQAALGGREPDGPLDIQRAIREVMRAVPGASVDEIEAALDWAGSKRKRQ
jgi:hypothetical protein